MNFYIENIKKMTVRSKILDRAAHKDYTKIYFVFFSKFYTVFDEFLNLELNSGV
jgi:hypothetical protein